MIDGRFMKSCLFCVYFFHYCSSPSQLRRAHGSVTRIFLFDPVLFYSTLDESLMSCAVSICILRMYAGGEENGRKGWVVSSIFCVLLLSFLLIDFGNIILLYIRMDGGNVYFPFSFFSHLLFLRMKNERLLVKMLREQY